MVLKLISTAGLPDTMLRSLAIGQLCHYGHADTIAEAKERFSEHCSGARPLPADLKVPVFSTCLANGDSSTFDQLVTVQQQAHMHYIYTCIHTIYMNLHAYIYM